ncbi:MAG: CHAT domain-containing protein [Chloroflexota bacterium]
MPIPTDQLTLNGPSDQAPKFIVLPPDATIGAALAALPRRRSLRAFVYVVVPLAGDARGSFLVPRWIEVELLADALGRDITGTPLADLPGLVAQIDPGTTWDLGGKTFRASDLPGRFAPVEGVEQDESSLADARARRERHPARRLVVLKNGEVLGLFISELLSGAGLPRDPFDRGPAILAETTPAAPSHVTPEALDAEKSAGPAQDNRTILGWIEGWSRDSGQGRTWRRIGRDEPLLVGRTYELKVEVDLPRADVIFSSKPVAALVERLKEDQDELKILVELAVDETEFRLYEEVPSAILYVPREVQPSRNRVTFSLEPLKVGQLKIKLVFIAFREVFQEIEFTVTTTDQPERAVPGGQRNAVTVAERGIEVGAALTRAARQSEHERVSLYITEQSTGYQFLLVGATVMRANVRIDKESIRSAIANARQEFYDKFVLKKVDGVWVYLEPDLTIPPEIYRADLEELSFIGRDLYQTIFYGRMGEKTPDAVAMGDRLRELSKNNTLDIKIVADRFMFPWQLMYDRPDDGSEVDPDGFWGFKHILQYMPEFSASGLVGFGNEIVCEGPLPVNVIFDERIDAQFENVSVIADQRRILSSLPEIQVSELTRTAEVINLFRDQPQPGQNAAPLLYFYVHNESMFPGESDRSRRDTPVPMGTDGSRITTSEGELLLRDIKRRASVELPPFKNAPLVFLNACQGAELQPGQYDGLLPYLMQRGARGAIGTEVNTPVNFAAAFGAEFVAEFARGEKTLGEVMLQLRRKYRDEHNNIMGLIYALYSSGDLIVRRVA